LNSGSTKRRVASSAVARLPARQTDMLQMSVKNERSTNAVAGDAAAGLAISPSSPSQRSVLHDPSVQVDEFLLAPSRLHSSNSLKVDTPRVARRPSSMCLTLRADSDATHTLKDSSLKETASRDLRDVPAVPAAVSAGQCWAEKTTRPADVSHILIPEDGELEEVTPKLVSEREPRRKGQHKMPLRERMKSLDVRRLERLHHDRDEQKQKMRKQLFDDLPESETRALRKAFRIFDFNDNGLLDPRELRQCLHEMGLNGATPQERQEIASICSDCMHADRGVDLHEFALDVVGRARLRLGEMRSGKMLRHFFKVDADGSGSLSKRELSEVARTLGIDPRQLKKSSKETPDDAHGLNRSETMPAALHRENGGPNHDDKALDFEAFQKMIFAGKENSDRSVREKERAVQNREGLSEELFREFRSDLLMFHDLFLRYDKDESRTLDRGELMIMLWEFGLLSRTQDRASIESMLTEADEDGDGTFDFKEFLLIVRRVRGHQIQHLETAQRRLFDRYDRDNSGSLCKTEVYELLSDMGQVPMNRKEQDELGRLIEMVDVDGSGTLDFQEMQVLTQRIMEKLEQIRYEEEVNRGLRLGFTEDQLRDMRWVFDSLDVDGSRSLDFIEVKACFQQLGKNAPAEILADSFSQLDDDGSGTLDFFEFLELMRIVRDSDGLFNDEADRLSTKVKYIDSRLLRSVLERFKLTKVYVQSLSKDDLVELFNDFFGLGPDANIHISLGVKKPCELLDKAVEREKEIAAETASA